MNEEPKTPWIIAQNLERVLSMYDQEISDFEQDPPFAEFRESLQKPFDEVTIVQLAALADFLDVSIQEAFSDWLYGLDSYARIRFVNEDNYK